MNDTTEKSVIQCIHFDSRFNANVFDSVNLEINVMKMSLKATSINIKELIKYFVNLQTF